LKRIMRDARHLDRDVETIVGKALEKDADRRYSSAASLSQDVQRYMSSQPILARPPSAAYQLRKFASRNRALVGGVAAAALALVAGVIVSTVFGVREAAERREAERARRDLEQVVEFQSMMLSGVEPEGVGRRLMSDLRDRVSDAKTTRGGSDAEVAAALETFDASVAGVNSTDVALRMIGDEILGRAEATIADEFGGQPLIEARLRHTMGVTYRALGLYGPAERQLRRAVELRRVQLGDEAPETLISLDDLALVLREQGRFDEATEIAERTLAVRSRIFGPDHPDTLTAAGTLAAVYASLGRLGPAEDLYARTLDIQRRVIGPVHPDTLSTMNDLGVLHDKQSRYREAEELLTATLQLRRRTLGNDATATLSTMNNLAMAYAHEGRSSEAGELFSEVLATQRRVLGDEHPDTLAAMNNLALTYASESRFEDAEAVHRRALTLRREVLGPEHPDTVVSMTNLASAYAAWGRNEQAEHLDRAALDIRMHTLGPEHPDTLVSMNNLAVLLRDEGRYEEAEPLLRQALDTRVRVTGPVHRETDRVRRNLIELYRLEGRTDALRPLVSDMLATVRSVAGREDALPSELNDAAWQLLTAEPEDLRDPASGLEIARRACELEEDRGGPELWNFLDTLALAWHLNGDTQAAVATERRALTSLPPGRPERAALKRQLAEFESALARQRATSGG
jgi:tetratricopeptide (TPR) repeat protein